MKITLHWNYFSSVSKEVFVFVFSFAAFKIFFFLLSLVFRNLIMICYGMDFFLFVLV